jgi:hypothetical protein
MTTTPSSAKIDEFRRTITDEVFIAMGFQRKSWVRRAFGGLAYPPAQRFARISAGFDEQVAEGGFAAGARWILPGFVHSYEARGADRVPMEGPVLIANNHPGAYDGLVLVANLQRDDLRVVASDVAFTRAFPTAGKYLIYINQEQDTHARMAALRASIRYLEQGGMIIIMATGLVDPDPAVLPGAYEALDKWSPSLEIMLRKVPETRLVPTIISGVLAKAALGNPLTHLPKAEWEQRKLAEVFQIIQQLAFKRDYGLNPRVTFGQPLTVPELRGSDGKGSMMPGIIAGARKTLDEHMAWGAVLPS